MGKAITINAGLVLGSDFRSLFSWGVYKVCILDPYEVYSFEQLVLGSLDYIYIYIQPYTNTYLRTYIHTYIYPFILIYLSVIFTPLNNPRMIRTHLNKPWILA